MMEDSEEHSGSTSLLTDRLATGDLLPTNEPQSPSTESVLTAGAQDEKRGLKRSAPDDDSLAEEGLLGTVKRQKYTIPSAPRETSAAKVDKSGYADSVKKAFLDSNVGILTLHPPQYRVSRLPKRGKAFNKAMEHPRNKTGYATSKQWKRIAEAQELVPYYMGRTASIYTGDRDGFDRRPSNGKTWADFIMPAATTNHGFNTHESIYDISRAAQQYMIGHHLMWTNIIEDEYLSYTNSGLFLIIHALNRRSTGQGLVTIQFNDRRRARPVDSYEAAFYPALELYGIFRVHAAPFWTGPNENRLLPRKFTQEFLSHGTMKFEDTRFRQATLDSLIDDGLFEIVPELDCPDEHKRAGLYGGQVAYRMIGFPPKAGAKENRRKVIYSYDQCAKEHVFTAEDLTIIRRVCQNFMRGHSEPHLHIFLSFCGLKKRPKQDPTFLDWMRDHYTRADVLDLYSNENGDVLPAFTHVASNLPEVMQYLDLVRDAGSEFDLPDLPDNVAESYSKITGEVYIESDSKYQKDQVPSQEHDELELRKVRDERKRSRLAAMRRKTEAKILLLKNGTVGDTGDSTQQMGGTVDGEDDEGYDEQVSSSGLRLGDALTLSSFN